MRRGILLAAVLALVVSGPALAADPPNPTGSRLISGGGRIWEDDNPAKATADITFSGLTTKVGSGTTADDYRCEWQVHFKNISVDWLDRTTVRSIACDQVFIITTTGAEGQMRVRTDAEIDGVPGYWLSLVLADQGEPGKLDQVRIRLWNAVTNTVIYDTPTDFTVVEALRTELDVGNIQSWIEA
jgi:hypothetical protein